MASVMRSCIQSILKLLNCVIGMVGIAMMLYAVWLIRVWQREIGDFPFFDDDDDDFSPWYAFLSCFCEILVCGFFVLCVFGSWVSVRIVKRCFLLVVECGFCLVGEESI